MDQDLDERLEEVVTITGGHDYTTEPDGCCFLFWGVLIAAMFGSIWWFS